MSRHDRPGGRVSPVSWLNNRFAARPPFHDAEGRKGLWAPFTRAPAHNVVRYAVPLAGIVERPWQVALLADLHVGSHAGDLARLEAIVAGTNALRPDLVLLLGDYVNMMPLGGGRVPPEPIAAILSGLKAPAGVLAVLGNHDWRYGRETVAGALEARGIRMIDNAIAQVVRESETLAVLGLEDDQWGEPDLTLFDRLPARSPVLVATHDPGLYHDIPPGHVVVAGHMHAGQIRWPGLPAPVVPTGRAPRRWAHGHIRERGGHLVVSAGLGTSGVPIRIGTRPEIVLLTLVPERG